MNPHVSPSRQRLTAAATVIGTTTITLILLVGMPCVLWLATGIPWPERVHSWSELGERLAQPVSDPLVIDLLAVVGWVCWAAFACTVIREIGWYATHLPQLMRDRHTHDEHVATLTVKGSLAALCIGTLVIAMLALWRPQTASALQPFSVNETRFDVAATAPLHPASRRQAAPDVVAATAAAQATTTGLGPAHPAPPAQTEAVRHIEYTVLKGDTLWDIAHTHMGDAFKWPRIYALNKGRVQRDGARFSDPDVIVPGWQLTVPVTQTATAPTPDSAPPDPAPDAAPANPSAPPAETVPAQPTPSAEADPGHEARDEHTPAPSNNGDSKAGQKADAKPGTGAIGLGDAGWIGITAAAGLLAARRYWFAHQRRLRKPDLEAGPPALSPLVDKAARAAHAATPRGRQHDPESLVTRRTPPQPPQNADTVTIGVRDNTEVPIDALAVPGGCTWTGPGAEGSARALLTGVLTAAERQRPGTPRVKAVVAQDVAECLLPGLPPQFTALTQSSDTAQAIQAAEQHLIAHTRTQHEQDLDPSTIGQAAASPVPEADPGTLLLLIAPDAARTGQLQALAARSRPGILIVLTLDALLPGAHRWHIAADGTTTGSDAHDEQSSQLKLFHLTPEAGRDMAEVLLGAHGKRPRLRIIPAPSPHPPGANPETVHETVTDTAPTPTPRPHTVGVPRPVQAKPVRLHVLGPISLYARGHQEPVGTNLRSEVHEFLALLAANPTGLVTADIADKLQLDGDSEQNALKNLRRAVRRALRTATGITAQEFILRHGELHKLHPELVETDLADFTRSLKQAFSASGTEETQKDALPAVREALDHYRGPFAQGGDYLWADAIREHFATQATDAACRLAHQAEHSAAQPRERDAALTLLEHLGTIHPDHERLAQHTIRLYQAAGRHDAARHTYTRLKRHLADLDLEPDPGTQALIAPRTRSRQTR